MAFRAYSALINIRLIKLLIVINFVLIVNLQLLVLVCLPGAGGGRLGQNKLLSYFEILAITID